MTDLALIRLRRTEVEAQLTVSSWLEWSASEREPNADCCAASGFDCALTTASRRAEIQKIDEALPKIPDRAAALFLLARRYAQIGDPQKALALLKECVA